jgi:hypothetical protein
MAKRVTKKSQTLQPTAGSNCGCGCLPRARSRGIRGRGRGWDPGPALPPSDDLHDTAVSHLAARCEASIADRAGPARQAAGSEFPSTQKAELFPLLHSQARSHFRWKAYQRMRPVR